MKFRRRQIEYLEGDLIQPSFVRKEAVETYAERVAQIGGYEPGGDLETFVDRLEGRIHYQHLDAWLEDDDGSIYVHGEFDFDILLPTYSSPLRDRFTICHELGHYFLHSDQGEQPIIAYRRGSSRIEWEANWFAAAFLMPAESFKDACDNSASLRRIAAKFGVSEDAARVRRERLSV